MTSCDLPSYRMLVRASALASNSGSYNSTAHAPACIQAVKRGGACNGSRLSPARKLLKLSFAGSSFIPYGKSVAVATCSISGQLFYFTRGRRQGLSAPHLGPVVKEINSAERQDQRPKRSPQGFSTDSKITLPDTFDCPAPVGKCDWNLDDAKAL